MKNDVFTGVCTALVTPFLDGKINFPMAQQLLRRQVNAGVKAVVLSGTTGESPTLTDQEKCELFARCKDYIKDDCTIIAGTGSNCTTHAIELSIAAEKSGADALLVVSPYYNKATPEGLYTHYAAIAHAVKIPLIVYNVPSRTGVDISVETYRKLSTISNIVGVKEASSDIVKIAKIRKACGRSFSVWSGNDDMIVPSISLGAKGVISVLSNVCPVETVAMCDAALDGDFDTASALQCELMPLIQLLFCEVNPIPVKEAMKCIGFDCGGYRLPLTPLSPENKKKMWEYWV